MMSSRKLNHDDVIGEGLKGPESVYLAAVVKQLNGDR